MPLSDEEVYNLIYAAPDGIEPPPEEPESSILSIKLRSHDYPATAGRFCNMRVSMQ